MLGRGITGTDPADAAGGILPCLRGGKYLFVAGELEVGIYLVTDIYFLKLYNHVFRDHLLLKLMFLLKVINQLSVLFGLVASHLVPPHTPVTTFLGTGNLKTLLSLIRMLLLHVFSHGCPATNRTESTGF
jgi:hypothetical protein